MEIEIFCDGVWVILEFLKNSSHFFLNLSLSVTLHVRNAQIVILFLRSLVDRYIDLWVILGCIRIVNEAIGEGVVKGERKRALPRLHILQLVD